MPRTVVDAVKGILTHDWDTETDLRPFLDAASSLVDAAVALARDRGRSIPAAALVEGWLAAHFYKYAADRQFAGRDVQGAVTGGTFTGQTAMYLEGTTYGQTALTLDPSGSLRAVSKGQYADLQWGGKPPADQVPYWDRGY